MPVSVGKLRQRVGIENLATTNNDDGSFDKTWVSQATVWASVQPLRGTEYFEAQQMKASADRKVTIRYRSGMRPQDYRFKIGLRVLNIVDIRDLQERNRVLECLCREEP